MGVSWRKRRKQKQQQSHVVSKSLENVSYRKLFCFRNRIGLGCWALLIFSMRLLCLFGTNNVMIIMILLFLFGPYCHYHHDIIGAQRGNLMIPMYDHCIAASWGGGLPRRVPPTTPTPTTTTTTTTTRHPTGKNPPRSGNRIT